MPPARGIQFRESFEYSSNKRSDVEKKQYARLSPERHGGIAYTLGCGVKYNTRRPTFLRHGLVRIAVSMPRPAVLPLSEIAW